MKYLPVLVLLTIAGCAEHHDLTQCQGPYLAMSLPPAVVAPQHAEVPADKSRLSPAKSAQQTMVTP